VIVSDCPPLKRVIEDSGGGLVFTWDRPEELADSVTRLYEDEDARKMLGDRGCKAFHDRYNWDSTSEELKELYRGLAKRKK